jgi:ElaB/YqjD/DUF883 family membrane-anchored ribosome-binding protein
MTPPSEENFMLTSANSASGKRDLHVGGLGADPTGSLAAVVEPLVDASENWIEKARELARTADDYVRENPWRAIGVVALLGVTLGFLLSRRS